MPDARFVALEEIHTAALHRLPPHAADFLETGAGTESTLRANREAFGRWVIRPRPMSGVSDPDTSTTFLGMRLGVPVMTAPFGGDSLFGSDGHLAVARANAACGTLSIVPEAGSFSFEAGREGSPAPARMAQGHPFGSFDPVVKGIKNAGYDALCVTVDCPIPGYRVRNRTNRFDRWGMSAFSGNVAGDGTPSVAETFGQLITAGTPGWD